VQRVNMTSFDDPRPGSVPWSVWHTLSLLLIMVGIGLMELLMPEPVRVWAWVAIMALMMGFVCVVGHGITGRWFGVLIDTRNKVSLSRLQMTLWTVLILAGFLTAVVANVDGGLAQPLVIALPVELWLLMGISTASMIGSPIILNAKRNRAASEEDKQRALNQLARRSIDPQKVNFRGQLVENQTVDAARISDLFQGSETGNLGLVDLGKVQMLFFTLVLLFAYGTTLGALFSGGDIITALPAMDPGMLALLTISHAGYLVNKALPQTGSNN